MNRQQIYIIDLLTYILFIPFIILVFSSTGWLLLTLVSPASQPTRPALVRIRHTLPPLPAVTAAPSMAAVEPAYIQPEPVVEPAKAVQPEPVAEPAKVVQPEPVPVVNPVDLRETQLTAETPVEQPPVVAPQPEPIAPEVEPTSTVEVAPPPVVVAESEPVPEPAPVIDLSVVEIPVGAPAETEAAAPVPPATPPLQPLFDSSSPPDNSFFDELLEQVRQ